MKPEIIKSAVPRSDFAETAVISIILQNYSALDSANWEEDLFFNYSNQILFRAAKKLHEDGARSDLFRLQSYLQGKGDFDEAGGHHGVLTAFEAYPAPTDIESALEFRRDLVRSRKYRRALKVIESSRQDVISMSADLTKLAECFANEEDEEPNQLTLKQQCSELLNLLESNSPPIRLKTGIRNLDNLLNGGFEKGTVAVFASETSGGKSIALIQTALSCCSDNFKGIIFSLEMSANQVLTRLVSCKCGVQCVPQYSNPSPEQSNAILVGLSNIALLPLTIFDSVSDISEVEAICRKTPCDFIVLDYIQLCSASGNAENREQQISEVVRKLKLIALKNNICVLTASQLNDGGELRESRAIGHHADYVLNINHRDHPNAEISITKNRNGERFVFAPVTMNGAISRFSDR
jgi:replicative DNA helicase